MASVKLLAEWFWIDRWMGSSAFLLPVEPRGLYREMMSQAWRRGARLPNDHEAIKRAVGCTTAEWRRCWPQIESYWKVDGDALVNETQVQVYQEALAMHERASSRGRKGAQARAQALAQAKIKQELKAKPLSLSPITDPSPPERSPGESARVRGRGLAYAGKKLEVPKFLDEEFVKRLNGQYLDLTAFYESLDKRLEKTGEPWDLRWIRDQFAEQSPAPERRRVERDEPDKPITSEERRKAEQVRRSVGCRHDPQCETAPFCVALIVRQWREQEREALSS